MESINGVSCNLGGLVRRCFYTGFVPEEKPGRGWRQGDVFKDDLDSDEEEVVYQQISKVMDKRMMVHKGVQMRELRQNDMVHNLALAVVDKDANLLSPAQNQEENIDNKEILEKKKLSSSKN